jgi:hypothetical protein
LDKIFVITNPQQLTVGRSGFAFFRCVEMPRIGYGREDGRHTLAVCPGPAPVSILAKRSFAISADGGMAEFKKMPEVETNSFAI